MLLCSCAKLQDSTTENFSKQSCLTIGNNLSQDYEYEAKDGLFQIDHGKIVGLYATKVDQNGTLNVDDLCKMMIQDGMVMSSELYQNIQPDPCFNRCNATGN